ncbi:unnamed protein product [Closterium sp. Naga37s-1]|nr:unnamed protein product [Closterium sp. Naga37s-1]
MEGDSAGNGERAETSRAEAEAVQGGAGEPMEAAGAGEGERGSDAMEGDGGAGERDGAAAAEARINERGAPGQRSKEGTRRRTGGRGGGEKLAGEGLKAKGEGRRRSEGAADSNGEPAEGAKGRGAAPRKGERAVRGSAGNATSSPSSNGSSGAARASARTPGSSMASPRNAASSAAAAARADGAGAAAESAGAPGESAGAAEGSAGAAEGSAGAAAESAGAAAESAGAAAEASAGSAGPAAVDERRANGGDAEGGAEGEGSGEGESVAGGGVVPAQATEGAGGSEQTTHGEVAAEAVRNNDGGSNEGGSNEGESNEGESNEGESKDGGEKGASEGGQGMQGGECAAEPGAGKEEGGKEEEGCKEGEAGVGKGTGGLDGQDGGVGGVEGEAAWQAVRGRLESRVGAAGDIASPRLLAPPLPAAASAPAVPTAEGAAPAAAAPGASAAVGGAEQAAWGAEGEGAEQVQEQHVEGEGAEGEAEGAVGEGRGRRVRRVRSLDAAFSPLLAADPSAWQAAGRPAWHGVMGWGARVVRSLAKGGLGGKRAGRGGKGKGGAETEGEEEARAEEEAAWDAYVLAGDASAGGDGVVVLPLGPAGVPRTHTAGEVWAATPGAGAAVTGLGGVQRGGAGVGWAQAAFPRSHSDSVRESRAGRRAASLLAPAGAGGDVWARAATAERVVVLRTSGETGAEREAQQSGAGRAAGKSADAEGEREGGGTDGEAGHGARAEEGGEEAGSKGGTSGVAEQSAAEESKARADAALAAAVMAANASTKPQWASQHHWHTQHHDPQQGQGGEGGTEAEAMEEERRRAEEAEKKRAWDEAVRAVRVREQQRRQQAAAALAAEDAARGGRAGGKGGQAARRLARRRRRMVARLAAEVGEGGGRAGRPNSGGKGMLESGSVRREARKVGKRESKDNERRWERKVWHTTSKTPCRTFFMQVYPRPCALFPLVFLLFPSPPMILPASPPSTWLEAQTGELREAVEGRRARRSAVEYHLLHSGIFLDPPANPSPEEEEEARREAAEVEWLRGEVRVARRWMDVQRLVWINRDRQHRSLLRRGGHEEQRAQLQHMIQQLESQLSQLERHEGLLREGNSQLNEALAQGTVVPAAAAAMLSFASFSSLPPDPASSFPHDLSLSDMPDDASLVSEPHSSALPPWLASPSTASASPAPSMGRPPSASRRSLPASHFAQPAPHAPSPSPRHSARSLSGPLPSPRSRWRSRSRNASGRRQALEPLAVGTGGGGAEGEEGMSDEASPQPMCAPFTPTSARRAIDQSRGAMDGRMTGVAEREAGEEEEDMQGGVDTGALTPSSSRFWGSATDRRQADREREREREWEREKEREREREREKEREREREREKGGGGGAMDLAARFTRALSLARTDADKGGGAGAKGEKERASGRWWGGLNTPSSRAVGPAEAYRVEPGEGSTILHIFHQVTTHPAHLPPGHTPSCTSSTRSHPILHIFHQVTASHASHKFITALPCLSRPWLSLTALFLPSFCPLSALFPPSFCPLSALFPPSFCPLSALFLPSFCPLSALFLPSFCSLSAVPPTSHGPVTTPPHQASRRMRSMEAGDFEIAECELFTARDDVDDLRAHPNLLSEHMLICLLRPSPPFISFMSPLLALLHLIHIYRRHAFGAVTSPDRFATTPRSATFGPSTQPLSFPDPPLPRPAHHPPSRRRNFFRSRSAANPSSHASHSPRSSPRRHKRAAGGGAQEYGSDEDAAGRPYPQAYGGVAVGGGGWEDGVSSTDGESPSGLRGARHGWDDGDGRGGQWQARRGRGRRGGGSMEEATLTEVSEWEEVGDDDTDVDLRHLRASEMDLLGPPSASPLRPRLRPRTPTTLWLRHRHRHHRSSGGGSGWGTGDAQQQGRGGDVASPYSSGRRGGGGHGEFPNPSTPSSGSAAAGALRLGRTTSTRVVTAVARVLPPLPPSAPAATPPAAGAGGAGAGAKGGKEREKEKGAKGKQGGKDALGGAAAAGAAAAAAAAEKGELGSDDFEKFFGTSGEVPAPTEWSALSSVQLDPYGVFGEHPCPDAGNYIQMLAVQHPPSEATMTHADATRLLHFRAMAAQLEEVDPSLLAHNERLAFWINIYNALLLYIYIVIPVPTDFADRIALFSKIRALPSTTFRPDDARSLCALSRAEPLVSFALCSGTRSSPSMRVYRAESVQQQLRGAMVEYLGAAVSVNEANKIIIPKLLHWYLPDFAPDVWSLLEWLANVLPTNQAVVLMNCLPTGAANVSASKCVVVAPFDYRFRYLIPPVLPN